MVTKLRTLLTLPLLLLVLSCSALPIGEVLKGLGGSNENSGVQVETDDIVVGKKEEDNDTEVNVGNDNSTQEAQVIKNNNRMSPWVLLLIVLLAGWAIPGPRTMFRGIKGLFTRH